MTSMLRGDAACFEPPPPGLGVLDFAQKNASSVAWATPTSDSTAANSPWLSSAGSPWISPYGMPGHVNCCSEMSLPDAYLESQEDYAMQKATSEFECEFKLEGVEGLQDSLTELLAALRADAMPYDKGDAVTKESISQSLDEHIGGQESLHPPPGLDSLVHTISTSPLNAEVGTDKSQALDEGVVIGTGEVRVMDSPPPGENIEAVKTTEQERPPLPARVKNGIVSEQPDSCTMMLTMTLQNIPKKYTRDMLVGRLRDAGFMSDIDFIYVPIDLKNKCNVGNAIINFRTEEARERFSKAFHGLLVKEAFPGYTGPKKMCEVNAAQIQGKDANVRKLQKSTLLMCMLADKPDWLPMLFDDNGKAIDFPDSTIE